jgi:hypothetical protein
VASAAQVRRGADEDHADLPGDLRAHARRGTMVAHLRANAVFHVKPGTTSSKTIR